MMKLGFASAILPDQNFEEVVDFASEHGFKCIEMMCWPKGTSDRRYAGVSHIDMDTLDEEGAKRIQGYLKNKGVELSALGYYPNPLDPDLEKRAMYVEHIKKLIRGAKRLSVNTINTFIGRDPKKPLLESLQEFKIVWPEIIRFAEENGVRVAIENCPMYFTMDEWPGGKNLATTPAIWREMFSYIQSDYFGLNYDPSHLLLQQMDYINPIYEFKEKLFHTHLKDGVISKKKLNDVGIFATPLEYFTPKIPGLGDIHWGKFISALTMIGYKGHVVIEVEDRAFEDTLEDRKKSILQAKAHVNQYLL